MYLINTHKMLSFISLFYFSIIVSCIKFSICIHNTNSRNTRVQSSTNNILKQTPRRSGKSLSRLVAAAAKNSWELLWAEKYQIIHITRHIMSPPRKQNKCYIALLYVFFMLQPQFHTNKWKSFHKCGKSRFVLEVVLLFLCCVLFHSDFLWVVSWQQRQVAKKS